VPLHVCAWLHARAAQLPAFRLATDDQACSPSLNTLIEAADPSQKFLGAPARLNFNIVDHATILESHYAIAAARDHWIVCGYHDGHASFITQVVCSIQRRAYLAELSSLGELRRSYKDRTLVALLIEAAVLHAEANLRIVELAEKGAGELASSSESSVPSGDQEATDNAAAEA
jgi:hypothetical protein